MVAITHRSGPLAGKVQSFEPTKDRIEIGRDPSCDIVYPEEETSVGHRHCALVRDASGDFTLHLYGTHFVAVDKLPGGQDQPLKSGQVLHLGPASGPSFEITLDKAARADELATIRQPEPTPIPLRIRHLTIAGGAIAALLILAVGGSLYKAHLDREQVAATIASLGQDQQTAKDEMERLAHAAAASIDQGAIDRLVRSTFLVFQQDAQGRQFALGTAWVVGPNVLATNAHVSAQCNDIKTDDQFLVKREIVECNDYKPGEKVFVRQPGSGGKAYEVMGHAFHPGYVAFPKFVLAEDPALGSYGGGAPSELDIIDGYDIGLLRTKENLPPGLALEIASPGELLALKPGMPLASAGYPAESVAGQNVLPISATPQVHYGNVSALTDYFFLPADPAHQLLVQHSIPIAGGASGSPVIAPSGHVVAVVSSGTMVGISSGTGRTPSAAEINYAQRADLVNELLANQTDAALKADHAYWVRQMDNFKRGIDVIGAWVIDQSKPDPKATAQLVSETQDKLTASDLVIDPVSGKNQRTKVEKLNLSEKTRYLVLVYASDETNIQIYLKDAKNQTDADNSNAQWYPSVSYSPPASGTWSLVVVGPDRDTSFTTRVYTWQPSSS
ncbi:MAG TPA: trypsin-like peptidase domain-containing protein [Methylovirgula sp.]|nr:trypsin-like peptidase domain-containing protein [Methylovirgula sp.]